jgi:hypothetical protein
VSAVAAGEPGSRSVLAVETVNNAEAGAMKRRFATITAFGLSPAGTLRMPVR